MLCKCWCWLRGGVGGQFPRNLNWSIFETAYFCLHETAFRQSNAKQVNLDTEPVVFWNHSPERFKALSTRIWIKNKRVQKCPDSCGRGLKTDVFWMLLLLFFCTSLNTCVLKHVQRCWVCRAVGARVQYGCLRFFKPLCLYNAGNLFFVEQMATGNSFIRLIKKYDGTLAVRFSTWAVGY